MAGRERQLHAIHRNSRCVRLRQRAERVAGCTPRPSGRRCRRSGRPSIRRQRRAATRGERLDVRLRPGWPLGPSRPRLLRGRIEGMPVGRLATTVLERFWSRYGSRTTNRLEPRPGFVELVGIVDVAPLDAPVRTERAHRDEGHLERSALAAPHPAPNVENAAVIEGEDMVQARRDVGCEVNEGADVRQVLVARVQRTPPEPTMVVDDVVRGKRGNPLLPVPRRRRPLKAQQRFPGASVGGGFARSVAVVQLGVGGIGRRGRT